MNTPTQPRAEALMPPPLLRDIGLTGRVAVSWTMAGGLLLGGVLVAFMTLSGNMSGHGLFMTSTGLFVIGALVGALHGAVLGFVGRPAGMERTEALRALGRAALYAIPGAAVAWLITVWVSMSVIASYLQRPGTLILVGVAWVAAALALSWAAVQGVRALREAYARWPERELGSVLVAASFAALLVTFFADLPRIWLLRLQVTPVGAVLLAVFTTLWLVGPIVTVALRLVGQLPGRARAGVRTPTTGALDVGLGLVAGAVVGLLAIPFAGPAAGAMTGAAGGVGAAVVAVAQALVDEILLRLFLLTALAWLILRWHQVHPEEAAVVAVAGVAVAQVLLYLPGVVATGFPSALAAVTFTAAAVLLPAVVFGAIYWARGFAAALVAHATAAAALVLLI